MCNFGVPQEMALIIITAVEVRTS